MDLRRHVVCYSRFTYTKWSSFCRSTFSASLAHFLPHSHGCSYYADEFWYLRRSDCINTLTYAHTNSRILPTCVISLGSLTLLAPEAGDFVELIAKCIVS